MFCLPPYTFVLETTFSLEIKISSKCNSNRIFLCQNYMIINNAFSKQGMTFLNTYISAYITIEF